MPLLITETILGYITTISIPIDAIFTVSLLLVFALTGYFFNNILKNDTNHFAEKINTDSKIHLIKEDLEDLLALDETTLDQKSVGNPRSRKVNILPSAKLFGFSSLAVVCMGGASLLELHNMQKSYDGMNTSQANMKIETESTRVQLGMIGLKLPYKTQKSIKQISYIDQSLATIKLSNYEKPIIITKSKENKSRIFSLT